MQGLGACVFAVALLSGAALAHACPAPGPVVAVRYLVSEQLPEHVEAGLTNPLEKLLARLPRLVVINSSTGHGSVDVELQFDGGATEQDLVLVRQRINELVLGAQVDVRSSAVTLSAACLPRWPWNAEQAPSSGRG